MVPATTNCPDTTATPAVLVVDVEDMLGVAQSPHGTHIAKMDPSSADIVILTNSFIGSILSNRNCSGGAQRRTEHVNINTKPEAKLLQPLAVSADLAVHKVDLFTVQSARTASTEALAWRSRRCLSNVTPIYRQFLRSAWLITTGLVLELLQQRIPSAL